MDSYELKQKYGDVKLNDQGVTDFVKAISYNVEDGSLSVVIDAKISFFAANEGEDLSTVDGVIVNSNTQLKGKLELSHKDNDMFIYSGMLNDMETLAIN